MYTIFFTASIQGSEQCWRKLLNAAHLFDIDTLIVSGNLLGSNLQPIVEDKGNTFHLEFDNTVIRLKGRQQVIQYEENLRLMGRYPCRLSPEEARKLGHSPALRQKRLETEAKRSLQRWLEMADRRLAGKRRNLILVPGRNDPPFVEAIIRASSTAVWSPEDITPLTPHHNMISDSQTPVCSSAEGLLHYLQNLVHGLEDIHNAVFNFHMPPTDSGLPSACRITRSSAADRENHPDLSSGSVVRRLIETYQPLLSLHGSPCRANTFTNIGRTLCCTPGNACSEGLLSGFMITLDKSQIIDFQPIQG